MKRPQLVDEYSDSASRIDHILAGFISLGESMGYKELSSLYIMGMVEFNTFALHRAHC